MLRRDKTMRLYLVRHGEVHNPEKVVYGSLPGFGLSMRGRAQVEAAAGQLRGRLAATFEIVCSPLDRTRETAAELHRHLGGAGKVEADPRLTEAGTGFDGLPRRFAPAAYLGRLLDARHRAEREAPAEVLERVSHALRSALERAAAQGCEVILVSHQFPIQMARVAFERGPLSGASTGVASHVARRAPWLFARTRCTPGSVTTVELDGGERPRLSYWEPPHAS